ncbi:MAG: hypothetical protein ABIZ56_02435 [Chthoniobacteraceae bacterium]
MRPRLFLFILLSLLASLENSFAELRIVSAYFGRPERNQDVKRAVQNYVDNGIFAFRISGENLGAKQHRGKEDYLRVVYELDGRRYTIDGVEGQTFTFQGVRNPVPDGLRDRPPSPTTAPIRITNNGPTQISAYSIDRYGAWRWQAEIPPGRTSTETGIVGYEWKLVNRAGDVLEKFTIRPQGNQVTLAAAPRQPALSSGYASLRVENNTEAYVAVYALDQWKAWHWKGGLAPGSGYEANVPERETWVVTTATGRIVRQFETSARMGTVRVAR